ncbi:ester cyclase [Nocardia puris]|uniref:Ketosteroid isomerase-like protein n=1 Tax=Nocardia puris TaxID=208602 RepID=A0A366DX92_9NOCA|nr:ester cyclase [Nocardia puris]MBF6210384.1 ester cyclase [Nocardia puris]MBF6367459.1 ester cyclase [Nocardia puris]MBF6457644.1 ester cyclase [Nocardia puris]RBO93808.1 ketosteroid isomerase-like protein [Nocardia puris]
MTRTPIETVRIYAKAKSRADVEAALSTCHDDAMLETVPFRVVSRSRTEATGHLNGFFRAFPDYSVKLEYLHETGDLVVGAGTIHATMVGPLAGIEPTDRRFALPFACHWRVRDGLIARERFFFDFHQMCEQLGLSTDAAAARFAAWRDTARSRRA